MSIDEKNIRNVTVPLKVEEIKEFFLNKELVYLVNYKESELKGVVFITYLSNLDLPAEISFEGCSFEEKSELLKIYLETRNIIPSGTLKLNIANILLKNKGFGGEFVASPIFNDEEIVMFCENHKETIAKWEQFIESTIIYAVSIFEDLNDELNLEESIEHVNDPSFVGANVVNMFSIPSFYNLFLSLPLKHELKYFTHQFQEYMFRGKNFYTFFNHEENNVLKLFSAHLNGDVDSALLNRVLKINDQDGIEKSE